MKVHTEPKEKQIILSIGMIVKNEEKVLERCLESLHPLMNAIPCELIIADTGSTDSTVEIARKYTDNVYYFEWINDFAAARNSTIKKASGQWYMYIDADEYLDNDFSELLYFLKNKDNQKYRSVNIIVRNYQNLKLDNYADSSLARLQKLDETCFFEGAIHETIPIRNPFYNISTIFHHTGYCFESNHQKEKKRIRNLNLMRMEYENNPENLRLLSHLIDASISDEREKYICEALNIVRLNSELFYSKVIYMQAIAYFQTVDRKHGLDLCDEYYRIFQDTENNIVSVAIEFLRANILGTLDMYEDACKAFQRYFDLYEKYKNGELNEFEMCTHPIAGLTKSDFETCTYNLIMIYKKLSRYNEAFDILDKLDFSIIEGSKFTDIISAIKLLCKESKEYYRIIYYYKMIIELNDYDKYSVMLYAVESFYNWLQNEEKEKFAIDIANSGLNDNFSKLMYMISIQNDNDFSAKLIEYIEQIETWNGHYSEVFYLAIKHKVDISVVVNKIDLSDLRNNLQIVLNCHDDYAQIVLDYGIPESFTSSIKGFRFITDMYELACYKTFDLNDNKKEELYIRFISLLSDYILNIYNPELLLDENDVEVLPNLHRFGYYMYRANQELESSNAVAYVKEMRKALKSCEAMKDIVEFTIEKFKHLIQ